MARVLAHPFRLTGSNVATVEDGSDAGLIQAAAVLVTTRRGERPLVPAFGISDPAFGNLSMAEINAGLTMFGPAISVDFIQVQPLDDRRQAATIYITTEGAR